MTKRSNLALTLALLALGTVAAASASAAPADYRDEIRKYRASREAELKADDGWLTVAGLFWLKPGANVVGSATGSDMQPQPDIHIVGEVEPRRHHARNCVLAVIDVQHSAHDLRIGVVALPPQPVADQGDGVARVERTILRNPGPSWVPTPRS